MSIIAKYKFNQNTYANLLPEFNSEFIDYTYNDETDTDGFTIRTIESNTLPTLIRFGSSDASGNGDYTKQYSLLEVSEINTSNVTDMSLMFYQCINLTYLNTNFNTGKVTSMYAMFSGCSRLTSLDLSNFNTNQVNNMSAMFNNCASLTSLDLSNFDTGNVTTMNNMFYTCSKLTSLNISNFNTEKVTSMSAMFQNCTSLKVLDLTSFDTKSVASSDGMFLNLTPDQIVYTNANLWTLDTSTYDATFVSLAGRLIASYKYNTNLYSDLIPTFTGLTSSQYTINDLDTNSTTEVDTSTWVLGSLNAETGAEIASTSTYRSDYIEVLPSVGYTQSSVGHTYFYDSAKNFIERQASLNPNAPTNAKYVRIVMDSRPTTFTLTTRKIKTRAIASDVLPTVIIFGESDASISATDKTLSLLEVLSINTNNVTSMLFMFRQCRNLYYVATTFNTSKVISFNNMFSDCQSLVSLDLSSFNTSNVTTMGGVFYNCSALTSLDLSGFDTGEVTKMEYMFSDCSALTSLDLSSFDTSSVTNMGHMFNNCSALTSLDVSSFDTGKVTTMYGMFSNCSLLTSLDLSSFNTSQVTKMEYMFYICSKLTTLDLSNFNTDKVTDMSNMFNNCSALTSLDLSSFNTSKVTNMSSMFRGCSTLTSLDVSNFDTSKVTNMYSMFSNCSSLTSLDLSNFNTSQVTNMSYILQNCSSLTSLDVSNFNTSKVTTMEYMFYNCKSLTSLDLSNWDTSEVANMSGMLSDCSKLTSLDLSNFNTSRVTTMEYMFYNCSKLTSLDLSNFDTNIVANMAHMFQYCTSLTELDLSSFNTNKVTNFSNLFENCTNLVTLDISNFHFGGVNQNPGTTMFSGCDSLKNIAMIYCRVSSFTSLQNSFNNLIATPVNVYYHDANLSELPIHAKVAYQYYDKSTVTLPYELNKLPNGVADYIDVVNGVYVQRVGKFIANSTESWKIGTFANTSINDQCTIFSHNIKDKKDNDNRTKLCDKWTLNTTDIVTIANIEGIHVGGNVDSFFINVSNSKATTVEQWKAYLQSNPFTYMYELKEPIYTPLTDEEKATLPLTAYASGSVYLESDELRPSKFEFRAKSSNRMQVDMLETGHYYLNAPTGNVKLGNVDIDVTEMPCIVNVTDNSSKRLVIGNETYKFTIPVSDMIRGYFFDDLGAYTPNEYMWCCHSYYKVDGGGYIYYEPNTYSRVTWYREDYSYISTTFNQSENKYYVKIPDEAVYMRFGEVYSANNTDLTFLVNPITLSKLPSHRIPTTFTQGMKSSVDFGYWEGIKTANPSYMYTTDTVEWKIIDDVRINGYNGIELHSITGYYGGTGVTVEDEIDISTGKYTKRVGKYVIDGTVAPYSNLEHNEQYNIQKVTFLLSKIGIKPKRQWNNGTYALVVTDSLKFGVDYTVNEPLIFIASNMNLHFKAGTFGAFTLENVQNYFKENPMTVYYELETPEITYLDLERNEFKTASNNTNMQVHSLDNSSYLKPQVKSAPLSYPTTLSPNTQYTVFHNRKNYNGSVKTPMINLGGTEVAATGTRTVVTTPSTLAHNELRFIGGENTVEQVMVLHGDWTKEGKTVDYFEGLQSSIIGDKTLENLVDKPIGIRLGSVTNSSNGGAVDYVSMDDIVVGYANKPKLPEVQVGTDVCSYGMTLQNLVESVLTDTNDIHYNLILPLNAKQNTTYTFICDVDLEYGDGYNDSKDVSGIYCGFLNASGDDWNHTTCLFYGGKQYKGKVVIKVTTTANSIGNRFRVHFYQQDVLTKWLVTNFIILEGDYTNLDIPFFEGIKSVENPIYHSVGKNLIDINTLPIMDGGNCEVINGIVYKKPTTEHEATRWVMPVKPNTTYTISAKGSTGIIQISNFLQSTSPEFDSRIFLNKGDSSVTFTTSSHTELTLSIFNSEVANFEVSDIQLEYGTQATSYEPYKSTVLSTPQGTVLRGVGSCKDVIGWNDGIIRRNCVEFTITGEEGYSISSITENTNTIMCTISWEKLGLENKILANDNVNMVICDKLPNVEGNVDTPHIRQDGGNPYSVGVWFWFDKTKFSTYTSQGINDYIKSIGGLTIVAPLADTGYEDVTFTNDYSNVDEEYQVGKPLIFNHGTLYTTTDTHPSTFLDFSLKTTNRYIVKDFNTLKYTVLTKQPFYLNGVDYPTSSTGMTIIDVTNVVDTSIYSDDPMITVVQEDASYYADGVLQQFKGEQTFVKEFIRTSNGTYNTGMTLLEPLELGMAYKENGSYDTYNPITGILHKNTKTITITSDEIKSANVDITTTSNSLGGYSFMFTHTVDTENVCVNRDVVYTNTLFGASRFSTGNYGVGRLYLYFHYHPSYGSMTVDDFKNLVTEDLVFTYKLETPQIIQATPTSTYISTRPENGNIVAQDTQIQAEYLNYDNEQSIISPRMLGDGDTIRWEQGSQCYVYENDNEYIPLTEHDELFGANVQAQEYTQYVESVDGAKVELGIALKEKAVYEQTYVKYEDNIVYPQTMENIDETNGVEVDYICGATWQNPNDLSDIRHLGELREDGQYDVTIRRSGDDEIRLLEGTTRLGLNYNALPPSEFELTFFNSGGVEVGKYGDTTHVLEDCVQDSKLASGTVYGQTMVNLATYKRQVTVTGGNNTWHHITDLSYNLTPNKKYLIKLDIIENTLNNGGDGANILLRQVAIGGGTLYSQPLSKLENNCMVITVGKNYTNIDTISIYANSSATSGTLTIDNFMIIEYQEGMENWDIPYFEGIHSTVVNGFSSCGKNLFNLHGEITSAESTTHSVTNNTLTVTGQRYAQQRINLKPNTQYTLSYEKVDSATGYKLIAVYYDNLTKYLHSTGNNKLIFRTPAQFDNIDVLLYAEVGGVKNTVTYYNIQLEEGSIATEYEPYKSTNYTLPTPITLRKVGDVCDTFDVVSGKLTQRIGEITLDGSADEEWSLLRRDSITNVFQIPISLNIKLRSDLLSNLFDGKYIETIQDGVEVIKINNSKIYVNISNTKATTVEDFKNYITQQPLIIQCQLATESVKTVDLIPSTIQTTQEPTFILPQPLRSVPNGICDRLYWDENKGHYCIEKRIGKLVLDNTIKSISHGGYSNTDYVEIYMPFTTGALIENVGYCEDSSFTMNPYNGSSYKNSINYKAFAIRTSKASLIVPRNEISEVIGEVYQDGNINQLKTYLSLKPVTLLIPLTTPEIIDLPHLNEKVELPTQPELYPIGYKVVHEKANPQLGLTIPYKVLNMPTQPTNLNFVMDIADYVLTWDDVKEARQYNVILNDNVIATIKEPHWNSGEEMYGYVLVEAQNEIGDNLSKELYIKTVPNAPAQLTVAHNPQTDFYDFEISFIDTSEIAEYFTVMYRVDNGEWVIEDIPAEDLELNTKVLIRFSIYEIKECIEVWATATNDIGTNDILPSAIYYMSPTPQWTYRINSKEAFLRWLDESPYDVQYKLRYSYKSNGAYQYAYFEGDASEIGKLYEAVLPLAEDDEVTVALCIISEKENLYSKPVKVSKALDPNIVPPLNFNYHWLARGLIEFYWEDQYNVDVEYEYILESMKSGEVLWQTITEVIPSRDVTGTGEVYRVEHQLEDLEQIRMKVRMKWAMNETEWSETLTTVFIPVEGNPPTYIRRTQTAEGLLIEWEAQSYIDGYHIYVIDNKTGEELQHIETLDNSILVDIDYSKSIEIAIYEISRFSGGIEADATDPMVFTPTMLTTDIEQRIYQPTMEEYLIETSTVQKGSKEAYIIHDSTYTPNVETEEVLGVGISTPFIISYHPMAVDVHQAGSRIENTINAHIKTLDTRTEELVNVMTFERTTATYDLDFRVYTPSTASYPINVDISKVRIVCLGDSLTSGGKYYQFGNMDNRLVG